MKRPKPNKNRPFLIASEKNEYVVLRIYYPNGNSETLLLFGEPHIGWIGSTLNYAYFKKMDKFHGWKTHFLGNL